MKAKGTKIKMDDDYLLYLEDIQKAYGNKLVLADIDLAVRQGEFCTVVGPSGCGKSTLLRLILGQEQPTSGTLLIDSRADVLQPSPERGIVYQRYSLFPHLKIIENIMIGLLLPQPFWKGIFNKKTIRKEALQYLEQVQLAEHAYKYPHQLSGGMRQRVAIAQALIKKPKILLMDEPFGALDPGTRESMQMLILELWEKHNMTVFFVTHDLEEAVFLGSRIIVMSQYYLDTDGLAHGARIVSDHSLGKASSTLYKESDKFGKLIQQIRKEGMDPEYLQHVTQFNLQHKDSFQTLTQEERTGSA
ncbi:ABC transporter ATP-binding protein [Desulfococcaceae bacterium HSG9]|nr:ABC transporter ATP-binding protein [Desulfococcaceae bacterium HSG9]